MTAPASALPADASEGAEADGEESADNSAAVAEQESLREVPKEEAKAYAEEAGLLFFETSAKTGEMVSEVFTEIGQSNLRSPHPSLIGVEPHSRSIRQAACACIVLTLPASLSNTGVSAPSLRFRPIAKKIPLDSLTSNAAAAARAGGAPAAGAPAAGRGERVTLGDDGSKPKDGCAC